MNKILEIKNIEKYYGSRGNVTKAIDDISFDVDESEFVIIMGASGSGKSTLLNCVSSLDKVTSGHIFVNGDDMTKMKGKNLTKFRRESLGFVFQDFNLLDNLTNYENIALALTIQNIKPKEIENRISNVSKTLGIEDILEKYPYEVSGGQKQRIACARAIVSYPKMVLADEPTGALDSKSARMLMDSLNKLNDDLKATILMVTHDPFSASYGSRIIFIKDGKIFNEIRRGNRNRQEMFDEIMKIQTLLGGELNELV